MNLIYQSILVSILINQLINNFVVNGADDEDRLQTKLLKTYDKRERPVKNVTDKLTVFLGISMQQLIAVDMKNQQITINAWLQYNWRDYSMVWDPKEYNGLMDTRFTHDLVWRPDILLYNSVDAAFDSSYMTNVVVSADGSMQWVPPGIFVISCKIDITWFPFDDQKCFFKFGSWTYDGTKIDLQPADFAFIFDDYMPSGEWLMYNTSVNRHEKFYDCCPEPYPSLYFNMVLRRRPLFYAFNLIAPCILITVMAIADFCMPPDSGEKVGLQVTILLAIAMFLNIVSSISPPTSESVPLLGIFFSVCCVVVTGSVVFTVGLLAFHHRTAEFYQMNHFTRSLLLFWVPWMTGMQRPGYTFKYAELPNPFKKPPEPEKEVSEKENRKKVFDDCILATMKHAAGNCPADAAIYFSMVQTLKLLEKINVRAEEADQAGESEGDWKFAAMAIDRFCLIVFSIFLIGFTFYIFHSAPYLSA